MKLIEMAREYTLYYKERGLIRSLQSLNVHQVCRLKSSFIFHLFFFVSNAHPLNWSNCPSEGQINEVPLGKNYKKHN